MVNSCRESVYTCLFANYKDVVVAKPIDVAKYLITLVEDDADELMSNLKLQKLLYYCQGFYLAMKHRVLFAEDIEAWPHGPVVPSVYHEYKQYGAGGIPCPEGFAFSSLTKEEKDVINEVYSYYGQFSAWGLRNMTHNEPPWKSTPEGETIPQEKLERFFQTKLK
jgi:uncharacterized phage-associated protein